MTYSSRKSLILFFQWKGVSSIACPKKHFFAARILLILSGLCMHLNSHQKKFQLNPTIFGEWPPFLLIVQIYKGNQAKWAYFSQRYSFWRLLFIESIFLHTVFAAVLQFYNSFNRHAYWPYLCQFWKYLKWSKMAIFGHFVHIWLFWNPFFDKSYGYLIKEF